MANAVLEQQQSLDEHFTSHDEHVDDDLDDLQNRVIALEYELKKARTEIEALKAEVTEREARVTAVFEAYKSIMTDLTEVIETDREAQAKHHEQTTQAIEAIESRLKTEGGTPVGPATEPADEVDPPKRASWPQRLFG